MYYKDINGLCYVTDFDSAVENGANFYWDNDLCKEGRSGGQRCRSCRKWGQFPRKRKNEQPVFLYECEECEIKDPFERNLYRIKNFLGKEESDLFIEELIKRNK